MGMKILIYGEYFLPAIGGVQTFMDLLASGLTERRRMDPPDGIDLIEVTVVTNTPRGEMDDSKLSYRVVRKPKFVKLVQLIRESNVVHIEGPCLLPMLLTWLLGKRYIIEHHVYQAICPNGLLFKQPSKTACVGHYAKREYDECLRCCAATMGRWRAFRALMLSFPRRWLCKGAVANVMVTDHVGRRLRMPRSQTIYHGIEITCATSAHPHGRSKIIFGYVGRLVAEKGLSLLIQAANHLAMEGRGFQLVFIGEGPERTNLESLVKQYGLGDRVCFLGEARGVDLARTTSEMTAIVMPSIWEETAGLTAIEQMMRGGLVIVADVGGLGEVVDGAGLKFHQGDWRSLASAMQRVIDEPSLADVLGVAARSRATALFGRDVMIERQLAVCRESMPGR
jgi:glycosyltransferase involved in cell wall biosynthesis